MEQHGLECSEHIFIVMVSCVLIDWIPLVSGAVGALIGTFGGAWLVYCFNQSKFHKVRKIAVDALKEIKKFAKGNQTYKDAESAFNNKLNFVQKSSVFVALYKAGLPIIIPQDGNINLSVIKLEETKIDREHIDNMISSIKSGYCDGYFYEEISSVASSDFKLKTIRKLGIRFVREVLQQSHHYGDHLRWSDNWLSKFTYGERRTIAALRENLIDISYFERGVPKVDEMNKLAHEIEIGLWDSLLLQDYYVYVNIKEQAGMLSKLNSPAENSPSTTGKGQTNQNNAT